MVEFIIILSRSKSFIIIASRETRNPFYAVVGIFLDKKRTEGDSLKRFGLLLRSAKSEKTWKKKMHKY